MKINKAIIAGMMLLAVASVSASELRFATISTIGNFQCNSQINNGSPWINTSGQTLYIKGFQVFIGVDCNVRADISYGVNRISDGMPISSNGWDHYENPTAPSPNPVFFGPDWITIAPGDGLTFFCVATGGGFVSAYTGPMSAYNQDGLVSTPGEAMYDQFPLWRQWENTWVTDSRAMQTLFRFSIYFTVGAP